MRARAIANLLLRKHASVGGGALQVVKGVGKALGAAGSELSEGLARAGVSSPVAHAAAKALPWVGAGAAAKGPAQRARHKLREWKYKREYKKALRQQRRGH